MAASVTTLGDLIEQLDGHADHALVFASDDGEIGAGYHVTELKQISVKSIDCGQRTDQWDETLVQLLDGADGTHMRVGKFIGIARKSEAVLPGLANTPLSFEYAPQNRGLRRMTVRGLSKEDDRIVVALAEENAVCKPLADWQMAMGDACCGKEQKPAKCC